MCVGVGVCGCRRVWVGWVCVWVGCVGVSGCGCGCVLTSSLQQVEDGERLVCASLASLLLKTYVCY